jgi:ATP-binding protein involved in chromosome partitioning
MESGTDVNGQEREAQEQRLQRNMNRIKHTIAVISGKGGVGKSTIAANLAIAFALHGHRGRVGLLDIDIHGPCIPKLLGLKDRQYQVSPLGLGALPVKGPLDIKVVSMDFLLQSQDTPVIWRGPLKMQIIRQFLSDFLWGELDYLVIDAPPGTGDEPLSIMHLIPNMDGTVIVTIPSEVSGDVVKKAVSFSRQMQVPIIGIVENMSGFICPECGTEVNILGTGIGQRIAEELKIPFLGKMSLDPNICAKADKGMPFILANRNSFSAQAFQDIVHAVEAFIARKTEIRIQAQHDVA